MRICEGGLIIIYSIRNRRIILGILFLVAIISIFLSYNIQEKPDEIVFLNSEELEWLDKYKDEIKIGYTTDYPPVEFSESNQYVGISADYFKLLEEKLKIDIEMVHFDNFDELMKQAKLRKISGITAATKTKERSEYLDFTIPYILNPNVIITRKNFSEKLTFEKLANSSIDILVVEGYDIIEFINNNYPKLEYRTVESASEGLRMISFSEADAMIIEIMTATATIESDNISNLVVNVEAPYESNLSIATRNDWPMLSAIFNKGLAQISKEERRNIKNKWVQIDNKGLLGNKYFWIAIFIVVIGLILAIIFFSVWNNSLVRAVKEKTLALEESNKELAYKTYRDELTGLYNRVYFAEMLDKFKNHKAFPFSVMVSDLNCLKITNDTFGHEQGDRLLIRVAQIISHNIKQNHIVCRIGGDEIVVLMPYTTQEEAISILHRIKEEANNSPDDPIKPVFASGCATNCDEDIDFNNLFKEAEEKMYENKMAESESTYKVIIDSLTNILVKNKFESKEHYDRLIENSIKLAESLNMDKNEIKSLVLLCKLHDIGKAGIDKSILMKNGPLSNEDWEKVKRHPELGFKVVSSSPILSHIGKSILAHHEHWDGTGYPQGLKEDEIPILARIFSIVEAYDVMTHECAYKKTFTKDDAIKELIKCSGTQFDPFITDIFINGQCIAVDDASTS